MQGQCCLVVLIYNGSSYLLHSCPTRAIELLVYFGTDTLRFSTCSFFPTHKGSLGAVHIRYL
jgi:hypothetical protein